MSIVQDSPTFPPGMRLTMPAVPGNVALARQAVAGLGEALAIHPALTANIKTAITEACTNVVLGSARDRAATVEVTIATLPNQIVLGVEPAACASSASEVELLFAPGERPAGDSTRILAAVLGRLVSMLAARAGFSLDRLSDAQLVSDALADAAPARSRDSVVLVGLSEDADGLYLRVGELQADGARALIADAALPGLGSLLESLADEITFEPGIDGAEVLRLRISRARV
jgi:serine/threonine-protein kinase RsbW